MEKKCNNCGTNENMTKVTMSSADWQRNEQRHLRREKRFVALIVLLVLLLVGSNIAWLVYENSFEEVITTEETIIDAQQDGEGTNIVGGGDINYGAKN